MSYANPNETLRELRTAIKELDALAHGDSNDAEIDKGHEIADLVAGLDTSLSNDGFLPADWQGAKGICVNALERVLLDQIGKHRTEEVFALLDAERQKPKPGKCTDLTGHLPDSEHRWQECPTYHDD